MPGFSVAYYILSLMLFLPRGGPVPTQDGLLSGGCAESFSPDWFLTCLCLDAHTADSSKRPMLSPLDLEYGAVPTTLPWLPGKVAEASTGPQTWGPAGDGTLRLRIIHGRVLAGQRVTDYAPWGSLTSPGSSRSLSSFGRSELGWAPRPGCLEGSLKGREGPIRPGG